ncbi:MAG: hypothetical protein Kow0047_05470 [Anaerolineae bacterium]
MRRLSWFAVAVLALSSLFLAGCLAFSGVQPHRLSVNLEDVLPKEWTPVAEPVEVDLYGPEGDGTRAWLVLYRDYAGGPIGAVVYEVRRSPTDLSTPWQRTTEDEPAWLVPRAILPNTDPQMRTHGYAGDDRVEYKVRPSPDGKKPNVLFLLGFWNGIPTQLTMARWNQAEDRFDVSHVAGTDRLTFRPGNAWEQGDVTMEGVVIRFRRPERVPFCQESLYDIDWNLARFVYRYSQIAFCRGIPEDPVYPEATVLTFLLRQTEAGFLESQDPTWERPLTPTSGLEQAPRRLITADGWAGWRAVQGEDATRQRKHVRVTTLAAPSSLEEKVVVRTVHRDDLGGPYRLRWTLTRREGSSILQLARWQIIAVELDEEDGGP